MDRLNANVLVCRGAALRVSGNLSGPNVSIGHLVVPFVLAAFGDFELRDSTSSDCREVVRCCLYQIGLVMQLRMTLESREEYQLLR